MNLQLKVGTSYIDRRGLAIYIVERIKHDVDESQDRFIGHYGDEYWGNGVWSNNPLELTRYDLVEELG